MAAAARSKISVDWSLDERSPLASTRRSWPPRSMSRGERPRARRARPAPTVVEALVRGDLVGSRYRLDERLARGGMGMVWAATDERTGQAVVVKTMTLGLEESPEAVQRFRLEAQLLASIDCQHIVRFLDHGVVAGAPFLVLERLWGEDLAQGLARGRLPLDDCTRVLEHIARALLVAHVRGVVHRDIKPANIFLARDGEDLVVKLLDFGIAKLREGGRMRTGAGRAVGSPSFMSPEQIRGAVLDGRSDLFSLGAVAYACVTGRLPFDGAHVHDTFQRTLCGSFTPPSAVEPTLPPALDAFFATALAVDREARFPNGPAMAEAFRTAVDGARLAVTQPSLAVCPPG